MKYCRKCGAELRDDDAFCPKCGAKVEMEEGKEDVFETIAEKSPLPQYSAQDVKPPKKKKSHKVRNIIIVVIAIFVLLSCAVGSDDQSKKGKSTKNNQPVVTAKVKSIKADYAGSSEAGAIVGKDLSQITVTAKYTNGKSGDVTGFKVKHPKLLKAGSSVTVKVTYKGKSTNLKVVCTTETLAQYKAKCVSYAYKTIARSPDHYKGKRWHIYGKIIQSLDNDDGTFDFRIATKNDGYGDYYDDVVYVKYEPAKGSEKLLEDDKVDVYGECRGDISYESTFGQKITIPALYAKYIIRR